MRDFDRTQDSALLARVSNGLKTGLLLAALSALALAVGQRLGGAAGLLWSGALVALMNLGAWWFSDRVALALNGARELPRHVWPELHGMLEQLARRAGLPTPRLYLIDSPTPNAFATGRSPERAAVAVTRGLLERLSQRELAGVLAHELMHVKHRDTLLMTIAATLAGVIAHVAQLVFWWGGALLRSDDGDDEGGGLASLGLLLVAPIVATLLQLAISRSREFDADAGAAELTGDPLGLASALEGLEADNRALPLDRSPATAHLFIVSPLSGGGVLSLFATHPPIAERVKRLASLVGGARVSLA